MRSLIFYSLSAAALLTFGVTQSSLAQTLSTERTAFGCEGHWTAQVQEKAAEYSAMRGGSAWIPVEVQLDPELLACASELHIGPGTGTLWHVKNGMNQLQIEPYNQRRNPLQLSRDGNGWVIPIEQESPQLMFWLQVMNADYAAPGSYAGVLVSQLYDAKTPWRVSAQKNDTFEFVIEPRVSVQIDAPGGGSGSYYRVDFGSIQSGVYKDFNLQVDSNTDIRVYVSSENSGELRHTRESTVGIPYRLQLNRKFVDLRAPESMNIARSRQRGSWQVPVRLDVPYVGKEQLAGEYSDLITIDVYPQD